MCHEKCHLFFKQTYHLITSLANNLKFVLSCFDAMLFSIVMWEYRVKGWTFANQLRCLVASQPCTCCVCLSILDDDVLVKAIDGRCRDRCRPGVDEWWVMTTIVNSECWMMLLFWLWSDDSEEHDNDIEGASSVVMFHFKGNISLNLGISKSMGSPWQLTMVQNLFALYWLHIS